MQKHLWLIERTAIIIDTEQYANAAGQLITKELEQSKMQLSTDRKEKRAEQVLDAPTPNGNRAQSSLETIVALKDPKATDGTKVKEPLVMALCCPYQQLVHVHDQPVAVPAELFENPAGSKATTVNRVSQGQIYVDKTSVQVLHIQGKSGQTPIPVARYIDVTDGFRDDKCEKQGADTIESVSPAMQQLKGRDWTVVNRSHTSQSKIGFSIY
ncbi:hypothetical protein A4A49_55761 [Nicotiana attenuata]|uniref:Uncharacterized protein n=1 Tax=Nicotiana attenuata TaxID=49451 RepID=A0A314KNY9_NICAT|nr:hypothetical protein A4A49_55761 [Nicotiana attenuata]